MKIVIRTSDRTRKADVDAEPATLARDLLQSAAQRWQLGNQPMSLVNATQGRQIDENHSLGSVGVQENDVIEIQPILVAGASNPLHARRRRDLEMLREFAGKRSDLVQVLHVQGDPPTAVDVSVNVPTAASSDFPERKLSRVALGVRLPADYPFDRPSVTCVQKVWHPNVFDDGLFCLGNTWLPTENLVLLILRIARLLAFDPALVSSSSPANAPAADWYRRKKSSGCFPTIDLSWIGRESLPTMAWADRS